MTRGWDELWLLDIQLQRGVTGCDMEWFSAPSSGCKVGC